MMQTRIRAKANAERQNSPQLSRRGGTEVLAVHIVLYQERMHACTLAGLFPGLLHCVSEDCMKPHSQPNIILSLNRVGT